MKRSRLFWLLQALSFLAFVCGFACLSLAVDVRLAWDPPTENADGSPLTDLAGFRVYQGASSSNYVEVVDVGNQTEHTITGLQTGAFYYFATTAYDASDNESGFSEELVWRVTEPVGVPDSYETLAKDSLVVAAPGVLANDTDFEDDVLAASLVQGAAHGVVNLSANGGFTYLAEAGFSGEDSFIYRAVEATGLTSEDTLVSIVVYDSMSPAAPAGVRVVQVTVQ